MNLILKSSLSTQEKAQVFSLQKQCGQFDAHPVSPETEVDPDWDGFFLLGYSDDLPESLHAFLSCMLPKQEARPLPEATFTLHVHPALRKQGIGNRLLREMAAECQRRCRSSRLTLHTYTPPEGDGYEAAKAMGFQVQGSQLLMEAETEALSQYISGEGRLSPEMRLRPCRNRRILASLYHRIFSVPLYAGELVVEELLAMPEMTAYVLFCKKKPLGMAMILKDPACPYLFNVGILPEYRRNRLASRMLSHLFSRFPTESKKLSLQVAGENLPARKLYESFGFRIAAEILEQLLALSDHSAESGVT